MFDSIAKLIHRVTVFANDVGVYSLLAIMFLTVSDVILRGFFSKPIMGAYEISEILLTVFILLGIAYTQQVEGNVKVRLLEDLLAPRLILALDLLVTILSLVVCVVITWKGSIHAVNAFHRGLATDILRIPAYPFLFLVPLGAGLVTLELLIKIVSLVRELIQTH